LEGQQVTIGGEGMMVGKKRPLILVLKINSK